MITDNGVVFELLWIGVSWFATGIPGLQNVIPQYCLGKKRLLIDVDAHQWQ